MKKTKLGDICSFNYGKSLTSNKRIRDCVPVYSSAGQIDYHNEPLVNSKGLIVGRKGTVGSVYRSYVPFFCIDTAFYILPNDNVFDFDYLYYALQSVGLDNLNEDSAVPGLNRDTAYAQEIWFPCLDVQHKVGRFLTELDDKIAVNQKINRNLTAIKSPTSTRLARQTSNEEAKSL
ncbi:MAG: restriction endonuclease subunit S [Thermoguttaceae bacterium]|nr:restriction endonuclease subunit S [Thermoguttaceae bacterium]